MKKMLMIVCLSFIVVSNAVAESHFIKKLQRGAVNVVTAPIEIPKEIRAHWIKGSEKTPHILVWIFCGSVKGIVMTGARMGSGAWDILTVGLKINKQDRAVIEPEYVFNDWPQRKEGVVYKNLWDR